MRLFVLGLIILLSACSDSKMEKTALTSEFRGVWIATVSNIDWPQKGTVDPESQRAHFLSILKFYQQLNFNAVIVQIRTAGDAFYPTELAPWSRFLTGKEGQAPDPFYDPLAWMIDAAHAHGMEFHAWMNPFRATTNAKVRNLSKEHIYHQHKNWMVKYDNKYYINPGITAAREHVQQVINEVVENYNIDGLHFDDYFYPYKKEGLIFNDRQAFDKRALEQLNIEDWRRDNINQFVQGCSRSIKEIKPWVQFGISPFGVWRNQSQDPKGSMTQAAQTNYDDLYADVLTWDQEGWLDYVAPQLYWSRDYELAPYRELINWWSRHNHQAKLYIGLGTYKVKNNHDHAWNDFKEIPEQIKLGRELPKVEGYISFSAKSLIAQNTEVSELLKSETFANWLPTPCNAQRTNFPLQCQSNISAAGPDSVQLEILNAPDYWQQYTLTYKIDNGGTNEYFSRNISAQKMQTIQLSDKAKDIQLEATDWLGTRSMPIMILK